jgi:preprotein translocase subunit SecG
VLQAVVAREQVLLDPLTRFGFIHAQSLLRYAFGAMLAVFAVIHVLLSVGLVALILMHSGRDAGLGGMGFTPASQGGTHIVERNLTRVTIAVAVLFFVNTIVLFRLLN